MQCVVLPAGTGFVLFKEIPALLACAIYPPAKDETLSTGVLRVNAEELHGKALTQAAIRGELPLVDHAGLPTDSSPRARLKVAAFKEYAARFDISVTVAQAGAKPLHEWTDEEIETTRQTALQAARVQCVLDEAARSSRALDALFASDEPPTRRAEPAPPTPAPAAVQSQAGAKKWTPERLEELRAYRDKHGTKKAAAWAGVSTARVRELLPGDKPRPKGYSAFNPRLK